MEEIIIINSHTETGAELKSSTFNASINGDWSKYDCCHVQVVSFEVSDLPPLVDNHTDSSSEHFLIGNLGQMTSSNSALSQQYLASYYVTSVKALHGNIHNPIIKLARPPQGAFTFSIVNYKMNPSLGEYSGSFVGNISVVLKFIFSDSRQNQRTVVRNLKPNHFATSI
jgi:hypothetical protein